MTNSNLSLRINHANPVQDVSYLSKRDLIKMCKEFINVLGESETPE